MEKNKSIFSRLFGSGRMYSLDDVHADLAAAMIVLIADFQEIPEEKHVPAQISKDSALLAEFGFDNAQNAHYIKPVVSKVKETNLEREERMRLLRFMEGAWERFGKDAMVVRYEHFFKILEKYDMVCRPFNHYTGTVPSHVLDTLSTLKTKKSDDFSKIYRLPFEVAHSAKYEYDSTSLKSLIAFARIPFYVFNEYANDAIERYVDLDFISGGSHNLFIAAPAVDMLPLDMEIRFLGFGSFGDMALQKRERLDSKIRDFKYLYSDERAEIRYDAINKAEEKIKKILIKEGLGRYLKCDFILTQPQPKRLLEDPFICSLTPHGVLIHAKWGAEAEDATIKRYEQLRDAIIGEGGAL